MCSDTLHTWFVENKRSVLISCCSCYDNIKFWIPVIFNSFKMTDHYSLIRIQLIMFCVLVAFISFIQKHFTMEKGKREKKMHQKHHDTNLFEQVFHLHLFFSLYDKETSVIIPGDCNIINNHFVSERKHSSLISKYLPMKKKDFRVNNVNWSLSEKSNSFAHARPPGIWKRLVIRGKSPWKANSIHLF